MFDDYERRRLPIDSVADAFAYIESFTNFEKTPFDLRSLKLDRMRRLLDYFDHPEKGFDFVHIAGSKGKGSTATFVASILKEAGHKTGLYTSPHLVSYTERITLPGEEVPESLFVEETAAIKNRMDRLAGADFPGGLLPTTFELLTLLGFLVFGRMNCRWVVLETGLGGRLDATNVVVPRAVIITPIELEHTEHLGDTLAKIAGEKAGIIKDGVPVFMSPQTGDVDRVIRARAAERSTSVVALASAVPAIESRLSVDGTDVSFVLPSGLAVRARLRLRGAFQAENAAVASLAMAETLPSIDAAAIERGLSGAFIQGRFELLSRDPVVAVDGSHTPYSIQRLLTAFLELFPPGGTLILGIVAGKRSSEIADLLLPHFNRILVTRPGTFKISHPEDLFAYCRASHPNVHLELQPRSALDDAFRTTPRDKPILITGSFYLAGEILGLYTGRR